MQKNVWLVKQVHTPLGVIIFRTVEGKFKNGIIQFLISKAIGKRSKEIIIDKKQILKVIESAVVEKSMMDNRKKDIKKLGYNKKVL